jgi:hypothetical protein
MGICVFCGKGICSTHVKTKALATGFGQKERTGLWGLNKSKTGIIVHNAQWCGTCEIEEQSTF